MSTEEERPEELLEDEGQRAQPKYLQIVESIRHGIGEGRYRNGARLPSEAELVRQFGVSRMTAMKAMQRLQHDGIVERRSGSGSYAAEAATGDRPVFGLLIPDLGQTDIFEPICKGMAATPNAGGHSLSWGNSTAPGAKKEDEAEHLCEQYIERRVSGVFFAPLEFEPRRQQVNHRVLQALKKAMIPVVLLDRCGLAYPAQCEYDIVGLNNRRAGYVMTEHLIRQGAKRVGFFGMAESAETVDDRIAGYREALYAHEMDQDRRLVIRADPTDAAKVSEAIGGMDAFLCGNDLTAAQLMRTLLGLGLRIPQDMRIAGIDDVRYSDLLPVPLTTLHQPCLEIGAAAIAAMLSRIANPLLAARSIQLNGRIVVRRSCGAEML